jgi:hypothetical protein
MKKEANALWLFTMHGVNLSNPKPALKFLEIKKEEAQ